jgi:hypothetical protein
MRFDLTIMRAKTGLGLGEGSESYTGLTLGSGGFYLTKPQKFRPFLGSSLLLDFFTSVSSANGYNFVSKGYFVFSPYIGFHFFMNETLGIRCEYRTGAGSSTGRYSNRNEVSINDLSIGLFYTIYKKK